MYINNDIDYLRFLQKKNIYIFGVGEKGKQLYFKLRNKKYQICGFIDNDEKKQGDEFEGKQILSLNEYISKKIENSFIVISSIFERDIKIQLLNSNVYNFISEKQIDFGGGEEYYDEKYFDWQREMGKFGAEMKYDIFAPHIKRDMTIVEFGSGGGYLLEKINAKESVGIEINDVARQDAEKRGIKSVKYSNELPDNYADIIISTSVLEHTENPLGEIRILREKLKEGGKIVFHAPNESCETEYRKNDINNHLYTWNCLNLGNLFKAAGFFVYSVERVQEVWPRNYDKIRKELSKEMFDEICRIGGKLYDENRCVIVAYK